MSFELQFLELRLSTISLDIDRHQLPSGFETPCTQAKMGVHGVKTLSTAQVCPLPPPPPPLLTILNHTKYPIIANIYP